MAKVLKTKLVDFIKKYHLNKTIESAKLICENGNIICNFVSEDKVGIGFITMEKIGLGDCELGIYNTSSFLTLLDFLSEDIDIEPVYNSANYIESLNITDGHNSIKFGTCDPSILKDTIPPELDEEPEYDFRIILNEEFMGNYIKSMSAFSECKFFTIISDGQKTEILMNYNKSKQNIAKFTVETVDDEHQETDAEVIIQTNFIQKIITANRNTNAIMYISKEGLVKVVVEKGDLKAKYFLLLTEEND